MQAGFSLLELLIVICITAMLAAMGISQWRDNKLRHELTFTTQQLAYFLNEAQVDAYINNRTYNLYLFTSPWCLMMSEGDRPPSCNGPFRFTKPYDSVTITGLTEKKTISFWGRRNLAQTASLQLKNTQGHSKVIISRRGRIRICSQNSYLTGMPAC
ncbi:prepilin-type N-terminal cleavage/methylation domain-containing protein [Orbaceae bacterium ESL0727]|nr:prepilin-type N-terminal cleavage/methylation domain-containing protein [Orbaceae bacterium ESL0727]